ncbi:hypothetical protein [Pedobacter gandavensis]|uniref:hypothetical protein n=1 Tax=Pedobacter gandavensis TaxID=2679963 RepID=UPI002930EE3E|nr:hypothetical protein [Pedobacter gandavensis]
MLKYLFVGLLIAISSLNGRAQEAPAAYVVAEEFNIWNKRINDTACVFADVAYLRDYPGLKGKLLDSLTAGTKVVIKSEALNNTFLKDFYAPWYKVEYTIGKQKRSGFIWLGLLALGSSRDQDGQLWMYGYNKYPNRSNDEANLALCEIKILDPSLRLVGRTTFLTEKGGQTYTEGKILNNMGLIGLQRIFRIGFLAEACGIASNHYYIGWTGTEFIDLPGKSSVSDAGVSYYEEKLLFPSEHKLASDLIIKDITEGEVIDPDQKELTYKVSKKREKYLWNGKMVSQLLEMK